MSTITRTEKRITISSGNVKFREYVMSRLAKDSPFNLKVKPETNDIVLRRASEVNFEKELDSLIADATRAQEPVTIINKVENRQTVVTPYKNWYWWGQKLATAETLPLEETAEQPAEQPAEEAKTE